MIESLKRKLAEHRRLAVVVVAVVVLGALALRMILGTPPRTPGTGVPTTGPATRMWTCSMHPQIRLDHPGQCPICGMDLVPVAESSTAAQGSDVHALDPHAVAMARVETAAVESRALWKVLRTVGKVQLDETAVSLITARVDGRVDRVFADFPGTVVAQGDHLVSIYSPDLLTTQREFLLNLQLERQRTPGGRDASPIEASRQRLLLWGITEAQLEELTRSGQPLTHLTVFAPMGGTVIEKGVRAGQYVSTGDALYTIADLGRVWVVIDVYERELAWVRFGQSVALTLESQPGRAFVGAVGFIEPVLNEETRTVRMRVMLENVEGAFKPGMFVQASLRVPLQPDGSPGATGLEGKFACPMHPFVVQDAAGACRVCGMPLDRVPGEPDRPGAVLSVPASAVLTTGRRQVVYVEDSPGVYRRVQPVLGPRAGEFYPVLSGLTEGQRVATRGSFLIDSQFQISGKPSLLYPEGTQGGGTGHAGHAMPAGGDATGHEGHAPAPPAAPSGHEGHQPPTPPTGHEGHEQPPPPPEVPQDEHRGHQGHGG